MNKLGLNDPTSPNYIADLNERIKVAAELIAVAQALGTTPEAFLANN